MDEQTAMIRGKEADKGFVNVNVNVKMNWSLPANNFTTVPAASQIQNDGKTCLLTGKISPSIHAHVRARMPSIHAHVRARMFIHARTHARIRVHAHTHTRTHARTHARTPTRKCKRKCTRTCTTYIHTQRHV